MAPNAMQRSPPLCPEGQTQQVLMKSAGTLLQATMLYGVARQAQALHPRPCGQAERVCGVAGSTPLSRQARQVLGSFRYRNFC